jgi:hypothetical protein
MPYLPHQIIQPSPALSSDEVESILSDLDSYETPEEVVAQRQHQRWEYCRPVTLIQTHLLSGDSGHPIQVTARDLSDGGVGLICLAPLRVDTPCSVELVDPAGVVHAVAGTVVSCGKHSDRVYLCGVRFDEPIDALQMAVIRKAG